MTEIVRSGLILLGGMASRAGFRVKYLFTYNGETFLDRQIRVLHQVTDEIVLSCRDEEQAGSLPDHLKFPVVVDERKEQGPSEGIRMGIQACTGRYVVVVACDMPFISPEMISYLFQCIGNADAAIPEWENGYQEPLHAIYRREALIGFFSHRTARRLRDMVSEMEVVRVPVSDLRRVDPSLLSFTNINHLDEYSRLNEKK